MLERFAEKGWRTIEADGIVRRLLEEDPAIIESIVGHYGEEVCGREGGVNRKSLGARVFSNDRELDWLEGLLHPKVREEWQRWSENQAGERGVVEIPLLFEKNLEKHFNFIVCIEARTVIQLERLALRNIPPDMALARMRRQLTTQEKCQRADFVLSNNGSIAFLNAQVDRLLKQLETENPTQL